MAKGQTASKTVVVNNMPSVTVSKIVELIVVNNQLISDNNDVNPGVNSKNLKN